MIDTDEIMGMIRKEGADYFSGDHKTEIPIGIYLEKLMEEKGISRKELAMRLNLDESYCRKIFGGQRKPTRKILLQCIFLCSLNLEDAQKLLEIGQKPRLYPRVRYDAAIIHGIEKKMTLEQMNVFLTEIHEQPLV